MRRIEWVDGLKAWAIFLVVLGHAIGAYKADAVLHQLIYLYHMPLFFMVSGITFYLSIHRSEQEMSIRYLVHRLINLCVPMFIFTMMNLVCMPGRDIFFYYNGIWYLLHLCLILIAYYVIGKMKIRQIGTILVSVVWGVMGIVQIYLMRNNSLIYAKFACEISKWCGYFIMFNFGIYVYTHLERLKARRCEFIFGCLTMVFILSAFACGMQENIALFRILVGIPGGGVYVFGIFQKNKNIWFRKSICCCLA